MLLREYTPAEVMWAYLEELPNMVAGSDVFEVFTHIDWVARYWPVEEIGPFDPRPFEEGIRAGMRALAAVRPRARAQHEPAVVVGAAVVERGGRPRDHVRQRRPRCRRTWPATFRRRR